MNYYTPLIFVLFFLLPWFGYKSSRYKNIKINKALLYFSSIILALVIISLIKGFNSSFIYQIFLPSRKEGLIQSGYQKLLLISLPSILLIYAYVRNKSIKLVTIFGILVLFITGQRRVIINFLLLGITLWFFVKNNSKVALTRFIVIGGLLVLLIPGLWYARSYTTQIQNDSTQIVNPLSTRSPFELIWGSSSSGFETLCYLEVNRDLISFRPMHSVQYVMASIVPRSLLTNKPLSLPMQIKQDMGLDGNPSIFFSNEMLINAGALGILFAFMSGALFRGLIHVFGWRFEVFAIANVITLFKNGFSYFITEVVFMFLFFSLLLMLSNAVYRKL